MVRGIDLKSNEGGSGFGAAFVVRGGTRSPICGGERVVETLAAGRSGSAAGQRLQRSFADQLPEPADQRIQHRFGGWRGGLRVQLGETGGIELAGES